MTRKVGALLLAAGFSNRFGTAKLLAPLKSSEIVFQQTLSRLSAAISDIVIITRPELDNHLRPFAADLQVFPDAERGMGASLAYGIQFASQWDACMICLADMPFIATETYQEIAGHAQQDRIVIPCFEDEPGNPVVFGRDFYQDLAALSGDAGGKPVVKQHSSQVLRLSVTDPAILADIDTPQDLTELQRTFA